MVAVKKVIDPFHDHTDSKRLLREIRLLRCLRHPNILHLTDLMPPPGKSPAPECWKDVYLVTRLFDTNLHRVIYSGHALTDAHIQYILWQIFRALRYLHALQLTHRRIDLRFKCCQASLLITPCLLKCLEGLIDLFAIGLASHLISKAMEVDSIDLLGALLHLPS